MTCSMLDVLPVNLNVSHDLGYSDRSLHDACINELGLFEKSSNNNVETITGDQKVYFYFFKRPERYNQEVEGIVLICNIDLYCVIAIFNGTGGMFNR